MKILRSFLTVLLTSALTFSLTACTSSSGTTSPGVISVASGEPQGPLITTNSTENNSGEMLDYLYTGLVGFDVEGHLTLNMAESIKANADSTMFDIRIKPGWTFHNGESVTSDSFINAWNFGANGKNAQMSSYEFENIAGYRQTINASEPSTTLSGLEKIDDYHFRVHLAEPYAAFPIKMGGTAFYPLPSVAFEDIKKFGEAPIGNGPYKLSSPNAWTHNTNLTMVPFEDYKGDNKARNKGLDFMFYTTPDAAYVDALSGNLDVTSTIPSNYRGNYQLDFPDSSVQKAFAAETDFTIPFYLDHFAQDEEGALRRKAISMSFDRELIQRVILQVEEPQTSHDFTIKIGDAPVPDIPGSAVLSYNPEKARDLWKQADAISPWSGTFEIAYNNDGGHAQWVEATTNMINDTLGIQAQGKSYPLFKSLRDDIDNQSVNSAYRASGVATVPLRSDFLDQYISDNPRNRSGYLNPEFDKAFRRAISASSLEEYEQLLDEAQAILFEDMPTIPQWYSTTFRAWNPALKNVVIDWRDRAHLEQIVKDEDA